MSFPKRTLEGLTKTIADLKQMIQNVAIPRGTIWWFHGRIIAPKGWAICDGTNGTPNLIGRYPLGATTNVGDIVSESATVEVTLPLDDNFPTNGAVYGAQGYLASPLRGAEGYPLNYKVEGTRTLTGSASNVTPPSVKLLPCMKL